MLADVQNIFSNDQALVTATATASTYVIDLASDDALVQALNSKGVMELMVLVTTTFTSAGAPTLTIKLQSDDDEAFGSATDLFSSATFALATLVAGFRVPFATLPLINEQYIRLLYTTATAAFTAGKIWAGLVLDAQSNT